MRISKHRNREEITEFEREWHHLRTVRTILECVAVAALVGGAAFLLWPSGG